MHDSYWTIKKNAEAELKIRGSRFIGFVFNIQNQDQADQLIHSIRKKYYSATHHCTAWRIGLDGNHFRLNDDGEPHGTAGKPILDAIDSNHLTDVLCVVTRYYGGVKLGTGNLARAYGECALKTLERAGKTEKFIEQELTVIFDYDYTGAVMAELSNQSCRIVHTEYLNDVRMTIAVRMSLAEKMQNHLIEATAGKIKIGGEQ